MFVPFLSFYLSFQLFPLPFLGYLQSCSSFCTPLFVYFAHGQPSPSSNMSHTYFIFWNTNNASSYPTLQLLQCLFLYAMILFCAISHFHREIPTPPG
uniref:Putative secreted protein n=1 Tax=Anopheles marajoara TaxID=58244 RepID=A0A2M4C9E5_9DIPT